MRRKFFEGISFGLTLSILISCFTVNIYAEIADSEEATLPKVRYYYSDSANANVVMTDNAQEFSSNMTSSKNVEVVFELDYEAYENDWQDSLSPSSTNTEIQAALQSQRQAIKEQNMAANQAFIEENNFSESSEDYEIVSAKYAPFVQLVFDTYADYQNYSSQILSLEDDENLIGINIGVPVEYKPTATRVQGATASYYSIEDAIADMDANDSIYDGSGVKIGIIEAGGTIENDAHSEFSSLNMYCNGATPFGSDEHAIDVTRILCGSNGVAPGVDAVYIYHALNTGWAIQAMDWLQESGVNIVNLSLSAEDLYGEYHWSSALLDYHVRYNRMTIVAAVGNDGLPDLENGGDHHATNYAMGYNVIAVAASDAENNIWSGSSYGVNSGINSRKPTISAPGVNIKIGTDELQSGTSLATPMVSGIVAMLMDANGLLMVHPEAIMASLIVGATKVNGQGDYWDTDAGAGRVNFTKALEASTNCFSFSYNSNSLGIREARTLSVSTGKKIKFAAVWLANYQKPEEGDTVPINVHTNYDIRILDPYGVTVAACSGSTNIEYTSYYNESYTTLTFQLRQYANRITTDIDMGVMTWVYE
ncbi:MAG: S8 family serine peptidase [Clostridia bacterium]|nr:S8 family serine peptidase [Clostridia bacterium]